MRARNIKPRFFKNPTLLGVSVTARLLFIGLWCMADREGLVEYEPLFIKLEVVPMEPEPVEKLLDELRSCRVIDFYGTIDEEKNETPLVIQIINFKKHQNPHKQEKQSELAHLLENPEITRLVQNKVGSRPADSLLLIPDSLNPDCSKTEREQKTVRATKIPSVFPVSQEMVDWAITEGITIDIDAETRRFVDYWKGEGRAKKDWIATWRNWMRKAMTYQNSSPSHVPSYLQDGKPCI